ncbi:MAG: SRPBCC family protein [Paracoccaceae bacterium]
MRAFRPLRFLKRLLGLVVVLVLLAVAVAYLLPRDVQVSRSITIDAAPERVFPLVDSLKETPNWSPWLGLDPEVRLAFTGPEAGVGNRLDWRSDHPQVGSGMQIITASTPDSHVGFDLDFGNMGKATGAFDLAPAGTGTRLTWSFRTDMGLNPVARWMGLMMDRWVGTDFERGLVSLKRLAEAG